MRIALVAVAALVLSGCASGPTAQSGRSNPLARASILSQNERSITIRHSNWGQGTAFKWAEEHCASLGKAAVPSNANTGFGTATTTTWLCQ